MKLIFSFLILNLSLQVQAQSIRVDSLQVISLGRSVEWVGQAQRVSGDLWQLDLPNQTHFKIKDEKNIKVSWPIYKNKMSTGIIEKKSQDQIWLRAQSGVQNDRSQNIRVYFESIPEKTYSIPVSSILNQNGKESFVYKIDSENKIQKQKVYVLQIQNEQAFVLSDLKSGDRIIRVGVHRVKVGDPVEIAAELKELL